MAPEKWWLEDYFPIGKVTFQGRTVKLREGTWMRFLLGEWDDFAVGWAWKNRGNFLGEGRWVGMSLGSLPTNHLRKLRCPPTNGLTNNPQYRDQKLRLAKLLPACFPGNIYVFLVEKIPDATTLGFTPKLLSPRTWFHREPQFDSIQVSRLVLLHSPPSCAPPPKGFVCAMATCYLWRIWNRNGSHGTLKRKSHQLTRKGSLFFWQKKTIPPKNWWIVFCWKTEWCPGRICCSSWLFRVENLIRLFCWGMGNVKNQTPPKRNWTLKYQRFNHLLDNTLVFGFFWGE